MLNWKLYIVIKVVFDSRRDEYMKRAVSLWGDLKKMMPHHEVNVFVWPQSSSEMPRVFGPRKGEALFMEPEFGDHVFIVFT